MWRAQVVGRARADTPVRRWCLLLALGAVGIVCYGRILAVAGTFLSDPRTLLWPLLGVIAVSGAGAWFVLRSRQPGGTRSRWAELALILAVGLAFRALFFAAPPTISHDAYRYVWDAHLLSHGISPYTHIVTDPALAPLRDVRIWPNINWRNAPTIYPPGAQLLFLLVNRIAPLNIFALKWAVELCDVLAAGLTLVLLRRHGLDLRRVIIYWWSPIPIIEFAFGAHIDAAALVWTLAAVVVAGQRWRGARAVAGVLLGLAVLTKLYPLLFALVLIRRRDRGFTLALGATVLGVYLAFAGIGLGSGGFLATYFGQRSVDQGILLKGLTVLTGGLPGGSRALLALQGLVIAGLCALVVWWRWRRGLSVEMGILALSAVWIALSPHLFPWYVALLLPFLALCLRVPSWRDIMSRANRLGLAATAPLALWLFALAMPLTYVLFAPGAPYGLFLLFFALPIVMAVAPLARRGSRSPAAILPATLPSGTGRLLGKEPVEAICLEERR